MDRTDSLICPRCGGSVDRSSNFCEHCAFNLTKPHSVASTFKRPGVLIGTLALSLTLLLTIGFILWRKTNHSSSTQASGFDLTPERVSTLARSQMTKNVEASLPKAITSFGKFGTYEDMRRAKVLDCNVSLFGKYLDCKPGPKGELFRLDGFDLTLPIGRKTPSVTGLSQADQASAVADVILIFEPSKGYDVFQRFRQAFYNPPIQDEAHSVQLKRDGDGWRIEKVE